MFRDTYQGSPQLNQNAMLSRKYGIFLQTENPELLQIVVELPNIFTVEDCIKFSIDLFNKEYESLKLKSDNEYQLKVAKKNGKPKDDLPCIICSMNKDLDMEQVLIETGAQLFTIIKIAKPQKQQSEVIIKARTSYSNSLATAGHKEVYNLIYKIAKNKRKDDRDAAFCFNQCV